MTDMNSQPLSSLAKNALPESGPAEQHDTPQEEAMLARLNHLFRRAGDGLPNQVLYRALLAYRIQADRRAASQSGMTDGDIR
jgi:hypothetical protein